MSHQRGMTRTLIGLALLLGAAGSANDTALTPLAMWVFLFGLLLAAWGGARLTGPNLPRLRGLYRRVRKARAAA